VTRINCAQAIAQLQDYLKQELTPEFARDLQEHLDRCRPCFRHARFEANFMAMLESRAGKTTCPKEVRSRVLAMLRAEADAEDD
jgi:anti-sigma factor (TIGR02949 family)